MIADPFIEEFTTDEDYDPFLDKARAGVKNWFAERKAKRQQKRAVRQDKRKQKALERKKRDGENQDQQESSSGTTSTSQSGTQGPTDHGNVQDGGQLPEDKPKEAGFGLLGMVVVAGLVIVILVVVSGAGKDKPVTRPASAVL